MRSIDDEAEEDPEYCLALGGTRLLLLGGLSSNGAGGGGQSVPAYGDLSVMEENVLRTK